MLVDMPLTPADFKEQGVNSLLEFYKKLGWDPDSHLLDPKRVMINSKDADECLSNLMKSGDESERIAFGFLWLDKGPSHSEDIPSGKVKLKKNWIEPE